MSGWDTTTVRPAGHAHHSVDGRGSRSSRGSTSTGRDRIGMERLDLSLTRHGGADEGLSSNIRALRGVTEAMANPITARLVVEFDPARCSAGDIVRTLERSGAKFGKRPARWHLAVAGLTCPKCARRAERIVCGIPGVNIAMANAPAASLTVEFIPMKTDLAAVRSALATVTYCDPKST